MFSLLGEVIRVLFPFLYRFSFFLALMIASIFLLFLVSLALIFSCRSVINLSVFCFEVLTLVSYFINSVCAF